MCRFFNSQHAAAMRFKQLDGDSGGRRGAIQGPAEMLAHMAASDAEPMMVKHFIVERVDQVELLAKRWIPITGARRKIARNLTWQPWPPLRRAANHDAVGA